MRQRTKEGGVILAQVGRYRLTRYDSLNLILERREDVRTRETGGRELTGEPEERAALPGRVRRRGRRELLRGRESDHGRD